MRRNEATGRIREKANEKRKVTGIPFMAGRPRRETVICSDDLMNLKIALATCKTLEEFLRMV